MCARLAFTLTLKAPTPQNGQTQSRNSLAICLVLKGLKLKDLFSSLIIKLKRSALLRKMYLGITEAYLGPSQITNTELFTKIVKD